MTASKINYCLIASPASREEFSTTIIRNEYYHSAVSQKKNLESSEKYVSVTQSDITVKYTCMLCLCRTATLRTCCWPCVGPGHPSSPLVHLLPHLFPLLLKFLSFIGFTYFLLLSIPSLSTRIVPLRFQAGGRRWRPNLGLVCVLFCNCCYLYSLVKMDCGVLFYLV